MANDDPAAAGVEPNPAELSALGGLVGTVVGARRGPVGAVVGGLVGGTAGYVAGAAAEDLSAGPTPAPAGGDAAEEPIRIDVDDARGSGAAVGDATEAEEPDDSPDGEAGDADGETGDADGETGDEETVGDDGDGRADDPDA